jgi:hypothetical protein
MPAARASWARVKGCNAIFTSQVSTHRPARAGALFFLRQSRGESANDSQRKRAAAWPQGIGASLVLEDDPGGLRRTCRYSSARSRSKRSMSLPIGGGSRPAGGNAARSRTRPISWRPHRRDSRPARGIRGRPRSWQLRPDRAGSSRSGCASRIARRDALGCGGRCGQRSGSLSCRQTRQNSDGAEMAWLRSTGAFGQKGGGQGKNHWLHIHPLP